jgi:hypothetical protein
MRIVTSHILVAALLVFSPGIAAARSVNFISNQEMYDKASLKKFILHHYKQTAEPPNQDLRDMQSLDFKPELERSYLLMLNREAVEVFRPTPGDLWKTTLGGFPVIKARRMPR